MQIEIRKGLVLLPGIFNAVVALERAIVSAIRARSALVLKMEDRRYGERLVERAKTRSSEAFVACDDPFEAVVFSARVEIIKRQDWLEAGENNHVDP